MSNNDDYFWCGFEARESKSIIIEYVVLFAQLVIFALLIYARLKAKRQKQLEQLSVVYKLIIAWLICFFLKTLINVIAYFAYIQQSPLNVDNHQNNSDPSDQQINFMGLRVMSSLFVFLDVITTFFLQVAMIYIPYLWMRNALQLMSDHNLMVEDRIKIGRISWFLGLIKKYLLFRNVYVLFFLAVAIIIMTSNSFKDYNMYITLVSIIESFVILIIYPFGLWAWSSIKKNISLGEKEEKSMLVEYGILMFCNALRIVLNSVFWFSDVVHYIADQYCYDDHDSKETMINCMYLVFGLMLMHILPGSMILYVYWPSKRAKSDLRGSLLVTTSQVKIP